MSAAPVFSGTLFALAAGLAWGLVFISPTLLPDYPAALLSFGRYAAFGGISLLLAWWDREALARLSRADWVEALKLALVGNILYYLLLASAIQRAGSPLPSVIIGTLPVVLAIAGKLRTPALSPHLAETLPWRRLGPPLALMGLGIALVNHMEVSRLHRLSQGGTADTPRFALGVLLALGALVCWTWYPLRNADWLRAHPGRPARAWATAQGLVTLPLALCGWLGTWAVMALTAGATDGHPPRSEFSWPLGPQPGTYVSLMLLLGLVASWIGTLCWNEASQRLPPALAGQLIVFETLAALGYAFVYRGQWPDAYTGAGVLLLVAGVLWALRSSSPPTPPPA